MIRVRDLDLADGDKLILSFSQGAPDACQIELEYAGPRDAETRQGALTGRPRAFFFPGLDSHGMPLPGGDFEPIIAAVVGHHEDGTPMVRADDIPYYVGHSGCRCSRCVNLPASKRAPGVVFEYPLTGICVVHVYAHSDDGSPQVCVDDLPGYDSCLMTVTPSDLPAN